ncbi:increased recombination centers protein 6 [Monosporozyma unispora]
MTRDKVLILCDDRSKINDNLELLFKQPLSLDTNIVKGIPWENKYYTVEFDLYIDEIDTNLTDWIDEFMSDECELLREVLAGIIFVLPLGQKDDLEQIQSHLKSENDMFLICSDPTTESEYPHWEDFTTTLEITTFGNSKARNEYGELMGIPRIQEIIDTYPWTNSELKQDHLESSKPEDTVGDDNIQLHHLLSTLQEAKSKYSENKDDSMAQELCEEIAKLILDS